MEIIETKSICKWKKEKKNNLQVTTVKIIYLKQGTA